MVFESVVPATTCTGDETVDPLVGVQIVTDGFAGFKVHCAAANDGIIVIGTSRDANVKNLEQECNLRISRDFDIGDKLTRVSDSTQIAKPSQPELLKSSSESAFLPCSLQIYS